MALITGLDDRDIITDWQLAEPRAAAEDDATDTTDGGADDDASDADDDDASDSDDDASDA